MDHPFHQGLYNHIKQQARLREAVEPIKQGSFHVDFPVPPDDEVEIAKTIESELHKFENGNGVWYFLLGSTVETSKSEIFC